MGEFLENTKTFFSDLGKKIIDSESAEFVKENKNAIGTVIVTGAVATAAISKGPIVARNLRYRTRSLKYRIKNIFRRRF